MKNRFGKCLSAFVASLVAFGAIPFTPVDYLAKNVAVAYAETNSVAINEEIFPDPIFRAYIADELDTDKDGALSEEEISQVEFIDVNFKGIESLKGFEFFC